MKNVDYASFHVLVQLRRKQTEGDNREKKRTNSYCSFVVLIAEDIFLWRCLMYDIGVLRVQQRSRFYAILP